MSTPRRRVASFVGVLPGPRNGMTLSTQQVVDRLGGECDLRTFDIGVTFKKTGWSWRVRKAIRSIRSGVAIWGWQSRDNENIYLIANSTDGLLYNIWQAWLARRRGFRCVLHHHVYHYIETHDWKMSWLLRVAGKDCLHIMACRRMVDDFNSTYSTAVRHLVAPPAIVRARDSAATRPHSTFAIGHLSNLSVEKGLVELLQTVDLLIKDGIDVRLVLAGPCASVEAKRLVATAQQRVGSRIEYRGPIHGPDTDSFFDDIDVFLFPTRIESW